MAEKTKTKAAQGFIQGALVLGIANFIVKIIGACFKIPLINLIGDAGSGYFNVAYQIYTFMCIVATAGFPVAISKMVSESIAKNNEYDANRVFKVAVRFLAAVGIIGTLILLVFSDSLANLMKMPDASLGIALIAPAVFFVALTSAYRGYFQGRQNMYPTAASEVIESGGKMFIGLAFAWIFMKMTVDGSMGKPVDFAASKVLTQHIQTVLASGGAIFGVTAGTFLSCLLMTCIYVIHRRRHKLEKAVDLRQRSDKAILKSLVMIAIPITIGASVSSLTTLIDMATITRRLVVNPDVFEKYAAMFGEGTSFFSKAAEEGWQGAQLLSQKAATLYGMYTGKALTMFNLPLTLVVALGTSVVPAISVAVAKSDRANAKKITESTLRIAMLFAAPCAFGMGVLSKEILYLLFGDYNAHSVLSVLSAAIIPVAVVQVSNSILQSYGRVYKPVIHMIIGGIVKVCVNFFCIPYLGIDGAPVGTGVCYLIIAVLNVLSIIRAAGIDFKWGSFVVKPILAAAIMGAAAYLLSSFVPVGRVGCIAEIAVCGVIYLAAVVAVKAVRKEDIEMLPKGDRLAALLARYGLLK